MRIGNHVHAQAIALHGPVRQRQGVVALDQACVDAVNAAPKLPGTELTDMEADIDRLTALAPPMTAFVLPGGTPGSAHAHLARTVCRRAEREVVALTHEEPMNPVVQTYLNRLSDWLFALARAENAVAGVADIQWVPKG